MRNQFFYTLVKADPKDESKTEASFNMGRVVRTVEYEPGKIVVLLDDFHQETKMIPTPNRNGKVTMTKSVETVASEIFLNTEDSIRYKALVQV